jgi:uncharacterized protein (DUF1800 family)
MTLFWHGYFAISNDRVNNGRLMHRHTQRLRRHALGGFEALLTSMSSDPAVLICLGATANRKARPNENLPRTLIERYTLGAGRLAEKDIAEAARAFTGWFVLRDELRFLPREHDSGVKQLLGHEGNLEGKDVVRILWQQPATPRRLVRRLFRWLISETDRPPDALISPLARRLAEDDNISTVVETMLRSNLFFSPAAYRRNIKSPVEFALGIVKGLEGTVGTDRLGKDLAALGQELFHPPTTRGWSGGRSWINRFTVMGRSRLAREMLAASGAYHGKLDPFAVAKRHGHKSLAAANRFLIELFLQGDLGEDVRRALEESAGDLSPQAQVRLPDRLRKLAGLIVTLPEFNLA